MRFEACGENSSNLYGSSLIYRMSPNIFGHFAIFLELFGPAICGAGGSPSPGHQSKGARSTLAS
jgi:hypothetical protein